MKSSWRVLIVDDHPVMVKATIDILEQIEGIQVIGQAGNGKLCLELIKQHQPEIVFLDYHLPDQFGSEVAKQIKQLYPKIQIIIFTGIDVGDMYNHLLELGVSGIISKESNESVLRNMILCIKEGYTTLPLATYRHMRLVGCDSPYEVVLSNVEVQIMSMLVRGATHEQIANDIYVSKRSVDNYLKKIYDKMGVKSKAQAIEKFVQSKYYN